MKPGAFTQLYIHLVFAVQYRAYLLHDDIRPRIFEYMSGIVTDLKHKSIIVNGMPDHVHILLGWHPNVSISDTVHDIKRGTSLFINREKFFRGNFAWQEGYGAFSYSRSHLNNVYEYIQNQQAHHQTKTLRQEYVDFLTHFNAQYDPRYLFEFFDDNLPTP
ncbi:transposase IS200-family protein [Candidatus Moduliflexus flocculans]|uniref:Transposase IS200-family protein n=1 Tax=Candidatus Moduliflexus flocculans TaxID=1499966 RepID=A0A0S6W396_9BACT|nr:transposase IS200-family protein [Candidatus Moduliflexus flocculans]